LAFGSRRISIAGTFCLPFEFEQRCGSKGSSVHLTSVFDLSPLWACLALYAGTFVQEGVALTAGAVLIINGKVGAPWVALSLYLGVVTGDTCIYGLGALAKQSAWAKRLIAGVDLEKAKAWMNKHLFIAVATSHLVPWILFPTFVAFGWFGVPFRRFALTSAAFNALYIPTALLLLTLVGRAAWPYLGNSFWIVWILAAVALIALIALRWRRATN
jgi:membrane protein DedA with SNARE-associated domain